MPITKILFLYCSAFLGIISGVHSQDTLTFQQGLTLRPDVTYARTAIVQDEIAYQIVQGTLKQPSEGLSVGTDREGNNIVWETIEISENGYFQDRKLRGGYLYLEIELPADTLMLLAASGHSLVYVNGEPRGGDVYDYGWVRHPVSLHQGVNTLLFKGSRGKIKAELLPVTSTISFTQKDMTLPSILPNEDQPLWGAIRLTNASENEMKNLTIYCTLEGGHPLETTVPVISPLTTRKVGFRMPVSGEFLPGEKVKISLAVAIAGQQVFDTTSFDLKISSPDSPYERTFISNIDGSVQYFSVTPSTQQDLEKPAMFLSLHGASVEARNQARAYQSKDWGVIVAPTNRRPYGFDWEDWGRLDALEVLNLAECMFQTDPKKTYLTGHSMGGHGTWQIGVNFPDRFAAIAPCAGWSSFFSYGDRKIPEDLNPFQKMLFRGGSSSNTLELSQNYQEQGVYILHGDADETVPVREARFMKKHLSEYHPDFAYYEKPGGSHWYGNESVDWSPIFEYFQWHQIPDDQQKLKVNFTTASPGISASSYWVTIYQQEHPFDYSHVNIEQDTAQAIFRGTTDNVKTLALSILHLKNKDTIRVSLDSMQILTLARKQGLDTLYFQKAQGQWQLTEKPALKEKGPHRYGNFKDAFRHHMLFVYGTDGTGEENAWAYQKARYDAETFWYRGNGSVDVISDRDFSADKYVDRNVILYGNADTNKAWGKLLKDCPVQVSEKKIQVGNKKFSGNDLACYFIWPRPNSQYASVGVVSGTGLTGLRAATENRYFVSGTGFPDLLVFSADMYKTGVEGIKATGFFGNDWSVENGDFEWKD